MRSPAWLFVGLPLLGVVVQNAYAQDNAALSPFVDSRVGGILLNFGRGSPDNDGDLLVAREQFNENFSTQSLYFRTFDASNDTERMHFDVVLTGATIQSTASDAVLLRLGDPFFRVGNNNDYDNLNANTGRGLEGTDTLLIANDNRSFGAAFTNGGGIDDFRVFISFDDLDPGNNINRGNAFAALTLYAGGAKSPLLSAFSSGTNLGVRVGETTFDSVTGDGDYTAGANLEPEGNGGFNSPASTQGPMLLVLLFEDIDIVQSIVSFPLTDPGTSTGLQNYTVDNFAQGVDLDGDNFADTNGSIDAVPNLSLERLVLALPDLIGPNGAVIPKTAIQAATNLGSLEVGDSSAFNISVNIPGNAAAGTYTGQALAFEDNNNNGAFDANETGDTLTLQVQVNQLVPDTDNDGLSDEDEAALGTNPNDADSDDDNLQDGVEVNGLNPTNPLDNDSDNDGLFDGAEDANHNGEQNTNETNPNDADSDNGGEPDGSEVNANRDPLDPADDLLFNPNGDEDGDGLSNILEDKNSNQIVDPGETDPLNPDTDQDALSDGVEDEDHDGIHDNNETSPLDDDSDDDGLKDGTEVLGDNNTDPLDNDSDNDGLPDGCEDTNQNGAFNNDELNPTLADTDNDGLLDSDEDLNGNCRVDSGETDGTNADTDDGGEPDGSEVDGGRDPLNPNDDLRGPVSIYEIGGGSCAVQPSNAPPWWVLLVFSLWFSRRRTR
jgi:hypothetical protein